MWTHSQVQRRGRRKSTWYTLFAHARIYSKGHMAELGACTNMTLNDVNSINHHKKLPQLLFLG